MLTGTLNAVSRVVSIRDVQKDASSYVDPNGFLFHLDGEIYRLLHAESAPLYLDLYRKGVLRKLTNTRALVPTELAEVSIVESDGVVVRHERVSPLSYCVEWCPSMLREAAVATLELAIELTEHNLMLQDAYPWNVLFSGTKPVFVDLTSIVAADPKVIWPAHEQFEAFFYRPLALASTGQGDVARRLLYDNISGIGLDQFYDHTSVFYHCRHPGLMAVRQLDRWLQRSRQAKTWIRSLAARSSRMLSPELRRRFLQRLCRRIERLKAPHARDSWGSYYAEISSEVQGSVKLNTIRGLLAQLTPATVVDLGSNTGLFSIEAARAGARVTSLDSSEACVEALFQAAKAADLPITPLVANVLCPTPSFGLMGQQYPGLWDRARSEMVLCLGFMHHLHLTGRQSFERIAELVSAVSTRHMLFEFVGKDDDNIDHLPQRRVIDYTLDTVIAALEKHFPHIQVFDSDRPTRRLLLCTK